MRPLAIWATIGAMTYWIYNQSYNYVLASRIDLTAVADVNAARLLLMPTIVLTVGVKTLLVPTAAAWLAESERRTIDPAIAAGSLQRHSPNRCGAIAWRFGFFAMS